MVLDTEEKMTQVQQNLLDQVLRIGLSAARCQERSTDGYVVIEKVEMDRLMNAARLAIEDMASQWEGVQGYQNETCQFESQLVR